MDVTYLTMVCSPDVYNVPSTHIPPLDPHHAPVKQHRRLRRIIIIYAFLMLWLLLLYIPLFHQINLHHHQTEEVSTVGWGVNRSRDLRLYILPDSPTAIISQPDLCALKLYLLVIVCSSVGSFEARTAIRQTWASAQAVSKSNASVRIAFLLGDPGNYTLQGLVEKESQQHGDVIQEGFVDSYNNLTLKAVMLLKWVHAHCAQASFIMKTDDDMFVNIENLVRLLKTKGKPRVLMGSLISRAKPLTDPRSKWYCPRYMFAGRVYPNYLSGTGYVMAADVARTLYQTALDMPFFHLEDIYLTGICARKAGIRPRNHGAFTYQLRTMNLCLFCDRSAVTSHHVDMQELQKLWVQAQSTELNCTELLCDVR